MCQGYSVVRAKKSHDIYVPEKKDKKQLVSKRDGAQFKNPVLQCLDFGCMYLVILLFGVAQWKMNGNKRKVRAAFYINECSFSLNLMIEKDKKVFRWPLKARKKVWKVLMGQVFLTLSMILNLNCFYSIFAKKLNSHGHFRYMKKHKIIPRNCCFSVITLCSPQIFLFLLNSNKSSTVLSG